MFQQEIKNKHRKDLGQVNKVMPRLTYADTELRGKEKVSGYYMLWQDMIDFTQHKNISRFCLSSNFKLSGSAFLIFKFASYT